MTPEFEFAQNRNGDVYTTRQRQPWRIIRIDRLIDHVSAELNRREGVIKISCEAYSRAWTKHPELRARRDALMLLRDKEVQYRERMAWKAIAVEQRRLRVEQERENRRRFEASKCPTCGHHTLAVAA